MARRSVRRIGKSRCLPSGDAAVDLVRAPSAWNAARVLGTFAVRGALVGTGLFAAGNRDKTLLINTIGATTAIEVGVLLWALWNSPD